MHKIDRSAWSRAEVYARMSQVNQPFYSVTFAQDVTQLYRYTHARGISFYYALVYLCTQAVNRVENFRYVIGADGVYLAERREPSFTDMHPGSDQFHIVTMPAGECLDDFCHTARARSLAQKAFIEADGDDGVLIYYSCLPWMDVTGLTNERRFDVDDTVPRIAWGKYVEVNGRKQLHISVEVNHRTVDGYHIGQFAQHLTQLIDALEVKA